MPKFRCPECGSEQVGSSSSAEECHKWTQCRNCKRTFSDEFLEGYWKGYWKGVSHEPPLRQIESVLYKRGDEYFIKVPERIIA